MKNPLTLLSFFIILSLSPFAFAKKKVNLRGVYDVKIYQGPDRLYEDHDDHVARDPREQSPPEKDFPTDKGLCTAPRVASDCCNYKIYDSSVNKEVTYKGPKSVFSNETTARNWAAKLYPQLPFFLPFNGTEVSLIQGWYYDSGEAHSGIDSWRDTVQEGVDVAFDIVAVAPGRVITKQWDNWFGNIVVIEHVAKNGAKYRSMYMHLRNGYTHDLNAASAIIALDPNANDSWAKYVRYTRAHTSNLYWGEESHTIAINVGDWVNTGQYIGKSGNTGAGGIGTGLNDDGSPMDSVRANNHLHFMLAVPSPKKSSEWIFVDPFAVYAQMNTGCYAPLKAINFPRFFAPYFPDFHNVSWNLVDFYKGYYSNMGLGLQSLSVYSSSGSIKAAGSFDEKVTGPWAAEGWLTANDFNKAVHAYDLKGLRPRELQVQVHNGQPRLTALWQPHLGLPYYVFTNMNDADFQTKYDYLVGTQGYRIEDYSAYPLGGTRRHAAIFVQDGLEFQLLQGLDQPQYLTKSSELLLQGWKSVSVTAGTFAKGDRFGGVLMKMPGEWQTAVDLTGASYQNKYDEMSQQGFRLWKVQAYSGGTKFGAIWMK
ncbi:MAG: hypothetical protein OM95_13950 [Bdellovibrio sp. ArHS]|uniref:M23 family metallopeptidase n=1 Tax=Bdellovibrio sp. ArHS TaxID=1569284 RepID=UPI000582ADB5|nr:M23 family metallopeptidase [Bdellovibrio sp. ArHS]KHD87541.1 MAG: hypothetical protein OM95_13950 [Bdellovibrio sp. ArHS]